MPEPLIHIVKPSEAGQRLRDLVRVVFPQLQSKQGARKAIRAGLVQVNGEIVGSDKLLTAGEEIQFQQIEAPASDIRPLAIPVLFEDDWLAVVQKPPGIEVSSPDGPALAPMLGSILTASSRQDALRTPWPVHRLDHGTSGALLVAKCYAAQVKLGQAFEQRQVHKTYEAIVRGRVEGKGDIHTVWEGKAAHTRFDGLAQQPSARQGYISHVRLWPVTGRTHQLRKHMALQGWPILGDQLYSPPGEAMRGRGLFLASVSLTFPHPADGKEMLVQAPLHQKFRKLWKREGAIWARQASPPGTR